MTGPKPPVANRRERKKTACRNKIIAAACRLFNRQGFDATSVADIMSEADLGTGTFYNYFKTKEDLVDMLLQERLETLRQEIATLVTAPGPGREKVYALFKLVGNSFTDDRQARLVILIMQGKKLPAAGISGHAAIYKDLVRELVAQTQAQGEFRRDLEADKIVSFLLGVLMFTVRQYLRSIPPAVRTAPGPGESPGSPLIPADTVAGFRAALADNVKMVLDGIAK